MRTRIDSVAHVCGDRDSGPAPATVSRRWVLRGAAAGAGLLATGGALDALGQFDGTPPAPPDPTGAPTGTLIADKAAELLWDQHAIFRFVADEVLYEAYAGALRGAEGALLSRSANSVDKALLLAALLEESAIPYRFASGPLASEVAADIAGSLRSASHEPDRLERAMTDAVQRKAAELDQSGMAVPEDDPDVVRWVAEQRVLADRASDDAAAWAAQAMEDIVGALADASIELPSAEPESLPERERNEHVWVQVADGPRWIDLDPTVPEAQPGETPATVAQTSGELPDELYHRVRVRVTVEELAGGTARLRDAVVREFTSAELVNVPLAITMYAPSEMASLGLGITELFSGAATFVPVIIGGMSAETADVPIVFGSDAPSVFGALDATESETGIGEGEAVAVWYAVEVSGPDREPAIAQRTWIDRLAPEMRASGELDPAAILPVTVTQGADGAVSVAEIEKTIILSVEPAPLPLTVGLLDDTVSELFANANLLGLARGELRTGLTFQHEIPAGFRSAIVVPHVTAFVFQPVVASSGDDELGVLIDLMHHMPAIVPIDAQAASTPPGHPGVLAGVLDHVSERLLIDMITNGTDGAGGDAKPASTVPANVSTVFDLAREQGIPFRVIQQEAELDTLDVPGAAARDRIASALARGQVVVLPARPVAFGGEARLGWWIVDPATGVTVDQMDDGAGASGIGRVATGGPLFGVLPGWAVIALEWLVSVKGFKCMLGLIGASAGAYLAISAGASISPAATAAAVSVAVTGAAANCIL